MANIETESAVRDERHRDAKTRVARHNNDETKLSFKTTEFWAMAGAIAAVLVAAAISDSLDDVRAWTLVTVIAAAYIVSRGLAKAGSRYSGDEDPLNR